MPRYFLEVSYKGTNYSGFQIQQNANTIQAEVEKALNILFTFSSLQEEELGVRLFVSSRTDAGVHALQNFFHFDYDEEINPQQLYNLNALLPPDISVNNIFQVKPDAHCRFNALSREYKYYICNKKNPFLYDRAYYYPYKIDKQLLQEAAEIILQNKNFTSFSKQKTRVKSFECNISKSEWREEAQCLIYNVIANRFLRGMVKGLTGTMLKVARNLITIQEFKEIIQSNDCRNADFSPPSHGLFLVEIKYPQHLFI